MGSIPDAHAQNVTLTLQQVRSAALAALDQGDNRLAIQLAKGLLKADPKDAQAYYIIARGYERLGDRTLSRKAAGYAYRYSVHDLDKYTTAQLAARMSVQDKRYMLAQYWVRRSVDHVPNERMRQLAAADFRRLRAENPWGLRLGFSIDPSNNINSGASDPDNEIDGSNLPSGILSPSALALSGVTATAHVTASYRLRRSHNSETRLNFRGFSRRVKLSNSAQAMLAGTGLSGRDFSNSYVSLGLSHSFRLGNGSGSRGNGYGQLGLTYGHSYFGGSSYYQSYRGGFTRVFKFSKGQSLSLGGEIEHRTYAGTRTSDTGVLRLSYTSTLANGGKLTLASSLAATNSNSINLRQDRASLHVKYEPDAKIGPARLSLALGLAKSHYYDYRVGFFPVPGGRKDTVLQGIVSFHFEDYDFAGFSPTLTLRARESRSNVGRFDTSELALSIGIKSNF